MSKSIHFEDVTLSLTTNSRVPLLPMGFLVVSAPREANETPSHCFSSMLVPVPKDGDLYLAVRNRGCPQQ